MYPVATVEFYEARIRELSALNEDFKSRIEELEALLTASTEYALAPKHELLLQELENEKARTQRYIDSYNTVSITHANKVEAMREWAMSELGNDDISETQAEAIAEIMGFELTQEFDVTVSVEYYVTVNSRDKESAQEAVEGIDFEAVNYGSDEITYLSATVERIDF